MKDNTKIQASSDNKVNPKEMDAIREKIHERIVNHSSSESNNNK